MIKKHEFQLPHGHYRFNYRQDLDGFFRVQTTRIESLEVTQQVMLPTHKDTADTSNMSFEISELHETNKGLSIEVTSKPKESTTTTTMAPVFYDSSNDENLFFTLPDLNFDSNSEEEGSKSVDEQDPVDGDVEIAKSPIKSDIDFSLDFEGSSSDIKNFSVMKRYLKKEKKNNIIIELKEVDEAGVVVKTEIVQANEFSVTRNSDKSVAKAVVDNK